MCFYWFILVEVHTFNFKRYKFTALLKYNAIDINIFRFRCYR